MLSNIECIDKEIDSFILNKEIIDELILFNKKIIDIEGIILLTQVSIIEDNQDQHFDKLDTSDEFENGLVKEHVQG